MNLKNYFVSSFQMPKSEFHLIRKHVLITYYVLEIQGTFKIQLGAKRCTISTLLKTTDFWVAIVANGTHVKTKISKYACHCVEREIY